MPAPIARVVSRAPVAGCGTDGGHRRHLRLGQRPCTPCCDAHNVANTRRRRAAGPEHPLQYRAALNGREPAEALTTADRARLVAELDARGWDVHRIAAHTRQTTYTTARIRDRLVAAGVTTPPNLEERTA